MVVEDDFDVRGALAETLEDAGYFVSRAKDGEDALAMLRASVAPSLILLDLMMPRMDGFQFRIEQLKDPRLRGIPVLVLTGDLRVDVGALQVAGQIEKPVGIDDLLAAVGRFC
jgi:CheY-like chemotaxis protein